MKRSGYSMPCASPNAAPRIRAIISAAITTRQPSAIGKMKKNFKPQSSQRSQRCINALSEISVNSVVKFFISCLTIFLFIQPTHAADLQVSVTVSKRRITLQENVTLTVTLKGNGIERMHLPDMFPGSFNVIEKVDKPSLGQDAFGRPLSGRVLRFQLQPSEPGRFRLGAFSINYFGELRKFEGENAPRRSEEHTSEL